MPLHFSMLMRLAGHFKKRAGLTTAATIWLAACLGIAAGTGLLALTAVAMGLTLLLLVLGGPLERLMRPPPRRRPHRVRPRDDGPRRRRRRRGRRDGRDGVSAEPPDGGVILRR